MKSWKQTPKTSDRFIKLFRNFSAWEYSICLVYKTRYFPPVDEDELQSWWNLIKEYTTEEIYMELLMEHEKKTTGNFAFGKIVQEYL